MGQCLQNMIITHLPHKFIPRPYQQELFNQFFIEKKRRIIRVLHRRAGKDKEALQIIISAAMQRIGTYYYTFPELKQARRVIWDGIDRDGFKYMDHIPKRIQARKPNNADMKIYFINGSILQLAGTDNYNSLMGGNMAGGLLSYFVDIDPYKFFLLHYYLLDWMR